MKKEFKVIAQIIQNNKRVLDVGCGDGTLMEYLKENQKNDVRGLEPKKDLVQKCISKGLSVIEGDAEKELIQFPKKSFERPQTEHCGSLAFFCNNSYSKKNPELKIISVSNQLIVKKI